MLIWQRSDIKKYALRRPKVVRLTGGPRGIQPERRYQALCLDRGEHRHQRHLRNDSSSDKMAPITNITGPSHLINPLATSAHLETSASQLDGVPKDLEDSIRYETTRLLQVAGILLKLPQELIAQAVVILTRYWSGPDGGSVLEVDAKDVAAAALYLTIKPSSTPVRPSMLLAVFSYLDHVSPNYGNLPQDGLDTSKWALSEGQKQTAREKLYTHELHMLRVLGFQTHVALPFTLCINYLQTLQVFTSPSGSRVAKRAFEHLNSALLSPQQLYLTHQPTALATAAIYLAAKEAEVKLPETEWWEVFDVDREELGFLVVALRSVEGFAENERMVRGRRRVPLMVEELRAEIERRRMLETGE